MTISERLTSLPDPWCGGLATCCCRLTALVVLVLGGHPQSRQGSGPRDGAGPPTLPPSAGLLCGVSFLLWLAFYSVR